MDEGVELAALSARVGGSREVSQQPPVKRPASETLRQLLRIHAHERGPETGVDYVVRQPVGPTTSQRKERLDSGRLHPGLTVGSHVGEEQVAKGHRGDSGPLEPIQRRGHTFLVDRVRARERDLDLVER